jgi:hypothetical protein
VFDLRLLTASPPSALTAEDAVLLAEINGGTALVPGGSVNPLSNEQWLKRWQTFRRKHPDYHSLSDDKALREK